jgi:hypothetical protein
MKGSIMAYPFDQLSALAKANFDLSLELAEIARRGNQDSLRAATEAAAALGASAGSETDPGRRFAALSEKGSSLSREATKIREQMFAETRAAFEKWQDAWRTVIAVPDEAKAADAFTSMLRFWQGLGAPSSSSESKK